MHQTAGSVKLIGHTEMEETQEDNAALDISTEEVRATFQVMGAYHGKSSSNNNQTLTPKSPEDEMLAKRTGAPSLEVIIEKEHLLDNGHHDIEENPPREQLFEWENETDQRMLFSLSVEDEVGDHVLAGRNKVEINSDSSAGSSTRSANNGDNIKTNHSSGYSSMEENDLTPKKNCLKSRLDALRENDGERRTSMVTFQDDVKLRDEEKSTANTAIKPLMLNSILPHPSQRRSTFANVFERSLSYPPEDSRRDSMPMPSDFTRNQIRKSSKKTFTVVNYGHVGSEASEKVPTGKESVTLLEILDENEEPASPVPSIQYSDFSSFNDVNHNQGLEQDLPNREIINVAGGRRVSVMHIHNGIIPISDNINPYIEVQEGTDYIDGLNDNVFVEVDQQSQVNASVHGKTKWHLNVKAMVNRGKVFGQRKKDRLVNKDGVMNICRSRISKRNYQFMLDLFTTLLDLQWRYVWALFALTFIISWLGFSFVWWLIAYLHGDFEPRTALSPPVCVTDLIDFPSAVLYSIETQHTIGYGSRALTTECPTAFLTLIAQSLLGVIVQCIMAGVVFAKLAKPKNRAETIMFSKTATICLEDGDYCLVFRVGDMRRSQLVGCNIRSFLVRRHVTLEGKILPFNTCHLHMKQTYDRPSHDKVQAENEEHDQSLFLAWPTRIIHRITPESPLWKIGEEDLLMEQFEIIVVLEATIESSGMTTQIRTSYLPSEIQWGETFIPLLTEQKSNTQVVIDYSNFHKTESQSKMPVVSAMMYSLRRGSGMGLRRFGSCRSSLSVRSRRESCYLGSNRLLV